MASRRRDEGQLLLLAGVLIVLAYILFSTQASLIATLGQEAGREASNPVITDYGSLRETIQVALDREQGTLVLPNTAREAEFEARTRTLLVQLESLMARRGFLFQGDVIDVDFSASPAKYTLQLYLSNGQTTVLETPTFIITS